MKGHAVHLVAGRKFFNDRLQIIFDLWFASHPAEEHQFNANVIEPQTDQHELPLQLAVRIERKFPATFNDDLLPHLTA